MSNEAEIRSLLEARARQIHEKNAEGALSFYGEDVVNFDLAPPLAYRGSEATNPAELQGWFSTWDGPIGVTFDQLEIRVANDLAFAYGLMHLVGKRTDGSDTDAWARMTVGLERRAGEWKIIHEHQSFPTLMDGSEKSATELKP
jgi:ketosteroid isomerase-like protein